MICLLSPFQLHATFQWHACYSLSKHLHSSLKCCLNAKQLLSSTWVMCLDSLLLSGCVRASVCTRTFFWNGGQLTVFIFATYFWKQTHNDTTSQWITSPLCAANSSIGSHKDGACVGWRMIKQPGLERWDVASVACRKTVMHRLQLVNFSCGVPEFGINR